MSNASSFACRLALALAGAVGLFGQADTDDSNAGPPRLKWGLELLGRLDAPNNIDFDGDHDGTFYLSRIRVSLAAEVSPLVRVYVQGQDARAFGLTDRDDIDPVAHRLDFHQAYAEFGSSEGHWGGRIGRQELAFGDERLIGADNFWDPLGFTFDALSMKYERRGLRVHAFGALVVTPEYERMARPSTGNRLYGIYASLRGGPGDLVLEPYFILNQRTPTAAFAHVYTYGVRTAANLPGRFDYNVEVALQRGHRMYDAIQAWAGHWELGHKLFHSDRAPRLSVEYNYGSGDRDRTDGRHSTFDDLYPAGFNKYGLADPFAWRNIRNIAGSVESKLAKRWRVAGGYRVFWLANIHDGLYTRGDDFLVWNLKSTDDHVGNQAIFSVTYVMSPRLQFGAGYARFVPGKYLVTSSLDDNFSTPYAMWSYQF